MEKRDELTEHLNHMDSTGSIKFTDKLETKGTCSIHFLDALISCKEDSSVKLQMYQKKTHTDQYLHFSFHHLLNHKLGAIRTLYDRCKKVAVDLAYAVKEIGHVNLDLSKCG